MGYATFDLSSYGVPLELVVTATKRPCGKSWEVTISDLDEDDYQIATARIYNDVGIQAAEQAEKEIIYWYEHLKDEDFGI